MAMELILTQDVEHVGKAGQVVSVKPGFGRNYLLPKGLAVLSTPRNKAQLAHEQAVIQARVAKETAAAQGLAARVGGMTLQFERLVGEDDKLFGSVTARDVSEQLEIAGVTLDHRKIHLPEPIRALGKYEVDIKLGSGVTTQLKFWVVAKDAGAAKA
jgi:large subunit ribosomal protein L9